MLLVYPCDIPVICKELKVKFKVFVHISQFKKIEHLSNTVTQALNVEWSDVTEATTVVLKDVYEYVGV